MKFDIDEIINTKTEQEIFRKYIECLVHKRDKNARMLRAAYIRKHTLGDDKIVWNKLLDLFVNDEAKDLVELEPLSHTFTGKCDLQYKSLDLEYSRLTDFLVATMIKNDDVEENEYDMRVLYFKNTVLMSSRFMRQHLSRYLLDTYRGIDTADSLGMVLTFADVLVNPMEQIEGAIREGEPIEELVSEVDSVIENCLLQVDNSEILKNRLRNSWLFFFIYHLDKGNLERAEHYRQKALSILLKEDYLSDVLNLMGKLEPLTTNIDLA